MNNYELMNFAFRQVNAQLIFANLYFNGRFLNNRIFLLNHILLFKIL